MELNVKYIRYNMARNTKAHEYTKADKAYILKHYKKDKTAAEIGKHIGVSDHAVKMWAYAYRLKGGQKIKGVAPIGQVRNRKRADGTFYQERKTEAGKWEYIKQPRKAAKQVAPADTLAIIRPESKAKKAKRRNLPKYPTKSAVITNRNPETVKIKSDKEKLDMGYQWVQIDHRTKVLRKTA